MIHYMTSNGVGNAWVANELRVMARADVDFTLHSLHPSGATFFDSKDVGELDEGASVLYPLPPAGLVLSVIAAPVLFGGRFFGALWNALTGPRESLIVRLKCLGHLFVACHWARGLRGGPVAGVHSQWIHSGGTVAMYGAWLLDVPFSFTGHAADLFRERAALWDKIQRAAFIVCISRFHERFFLEEGARSEQLVLAYCGVDVGHFRPKPPDATRALRRARLLASGRLVEKKGFVHLIAACQELVARGVDFECVIAGSGPLEETLRQSVDKAGLAERVAITGDPLKQEEIPEFMNGGDVYCLPCVWASDGDVDGLPQMLMEAMACGLPAVSTRLVGIPDLLGDGAGVMVEPSDACEIADAIQSLLDDPSLAAAFARAGRARVESMFDLKDCLEPLIERFRAQMEYA